MQLLLHPFMHEEGLIGTSRRGDLPERPPFFRRQRDGDSRPHEHRLGDFLELGIEVGHVVSVPELGQFPDRISFRNLHDFQRA
jgi:hypothetical protein